MTASIGTPTYPHFLKQDVCCLYCCSAVDFFKFCFYFVLFCFVLYCIVLYCFVIFCFVCFVCFVCFILFCLFCLFCFVLCVLFCFVCFVLFVLFCFILFCFVLFCFVLFCFIVILLDDSGHLIFLEINWQNLKLKGLKWGYTHAICPTSNFELIESIAQSHTYVVIFSDFVSTFLTNLKGYSRCRKLTSWWVTLPWPPKSGNGQNITFTHPILR